jgi:hypothetical protein
MQQAHRLLKTGGLLVVHTMDIDSLFARVMGSRWPWLMEMHIYYFSRRTLKPMLEKARLYGDAAIGVVSSLASQGVLCWRALPEVST